MLIHRAQSAWTRVLLSSNIILEGDLQGLGFPMGFPLPRTWGGGMGEAMADHHTSELQEAEWTFGQPSLCRALNMQLPCAHGPRCMQFLHAQSCIHSPHTEPICT